MDEVNKEYLFEDSVDIFNENIPFYSRGRHAMWFPYKPTRDIVFIYQVPKPKKMGNIVIPYQYRKFYRDPIGYVLAVGPGYYDKKGKFHSTCLKIGQKIIFNADTPWTRKVKALDGKDYIVRVVGEQDIVAVIEE